ncbi:MAG: hypothetical protein MJ252_23180 [archaeon]|nr:hypothetical protein [archaeon]
MIFDTIATIFYFILKVGGDAVAEMTKNQIGDKYSPFIGKILLTIAGAVFLLDCGHYAGFNLCRIFRGIIYLIYGKIYYS